MLLDRVANHEGWDQGWNFKGMSQFGSPSSQLDKDIMMLGRLKSKAAVPHFIKKLRELEAESDFSHHRASYLALEWIGEPSASEALVEHLNKAGMRGHAHLTVEAAFERIKATSTSIWEKEAAAIRSRKSVPHECCTGWEIATVSEKRSLKSTPKI